jgi:Trk K+ transport system NAD-binding subunit
VVIGLGRFGSAVAECLVRLGQEVLAIEEDQALVEKWADTLTHVVQADSTDEEALRQLGVGDFDRAVVAIGADIEASVLTVLALAEAGVNDIWAKAITPKQGQILERVGKGGMGVLYRGVDSVLDREVAIKVMLVDFSDDTEQMRPRFYREAQAAAKLQHSNIVTIFEFAEDHNTPYIVMEFLRGTPLDARMASPLPLTSPRPSGRKAAS